MRAQRRRMSPVGEATPQINVARAVKPGRCWRLQAGGGAHPWRWGGSGRLRFPQLGSSSTPRWTGCPRRKFHEALLTNRKQIKQRQQKCADSPSPRPLTRASLLAAGSDLLSFSGTRLPPEERPVAEPAPLLGPAPTALRAARPQRPRLPLPVHWTHAGVSWAARSHSSVTVAGVSGL